MPHHGRRGVSVQGRGGRKEKRERCFVDRVGKRIVLGTGGDVMKMWVV